MAIAAFDPTAHAKLATAARAGPGPKFLNTAEFMAGFKLPGYVLDGVLLRGNLYSLTGKTGHDKSAVALALTFMLATGEGRLNGSEVERGKVVYLAAENPDDIRMRVLLMCARLGVSLDDLDVAWVAGAFDLQAGLEEAAKHASTQAPHSPYRAAQRTRTATAGNSTSPSGCARSLSLRAGQPCWR